MAKSRGVSEQYGGVSSPQYVWMQGEPPLAASSSFQRAEQERIRIFEELPHATVVDVARPVSNDISQIQIQLVYIIEIEYKEFKWRLVKKASQVLYLHSALKKRVIIEELHEKQEQASHV